MIRLTEQVHDNDHICSDGYSRVWHHKSLYQKLEGENSYLKFMDHAIQNGLWNKYSVDSAGLKSYLMNKGISSKGWRYFCQYGDAMFELLWVSQSSHNYLEVAINYLHVLDKAGCPDLPTSQFQKQWFSFYGDSFGYKQEDSYVWDNIPIQMLKVMFNHLFQLKCFSDEEMNKLEKVFQWLDVMKPVFDRNQLKSTWSWFVKKADDWYRDTKLKLQAENLSWKPVFNLKEIYMDGFLIYELGNAYQLFEASIILRNCLDTYSNLCMSNQKRLFTVYENKKQKRPMAAIGLEWSDDEQWSIFEIKGFANQSVNDEMIELSKRLCFMANQKVEPISKQLELFLDKPVRLPIPLARRPYQSEWIYK